MRKINTTLIADEWERQNVHRVLNRGENYHQLRRAISYANFGKLRFKTEYEHFHGRFEFGKTPETIDMEAILQQLLCPRSI
ncbi:MAG: Tn3 family transposase [Cyanobacteria bacterium P01_A01_bin.17]